MFFRRRSPDDTRPADEPRTVPEAQKWLRHHGLSECTEETARSLLAIRNGVREGKVGRDDR